MVNPQKKYVPTGNYRLRKPLIPRRPINDFPVKMIVCSGLGE